MTGLEPLRDIFTPDQAAKYLQLNRETIYRYIREGKLPASKFGRSYRIDRQSLQMLLVATRTSQGIPLRDYSREELDQFLEDDQLDEKTLGIVGHFKKVMEAAKSRP